MADLPTLQDATLTLEQRVATLTLNRHDVRNALTGTELISDIVNMSTGRTGMRAFRY